MERFYPKCLTTYITKNINTKERTFPFNIKTITGNNACKTVPETSFPHFFLGGGCRPVPYIRSDGLPILPGSAAGAAALKYALRISQKRPWLLLWCMAGPPTKPARCKSTRQGWAREAAQWAAVRPKWSRLSWRWKNLRDITDITILTDDKGYQSFKSPQLQERFAHLSQTLAVFVASIICQQCNWSSRRGLHWGSGVRSVVARDCRPLPNAKQTRRTPTEEMWKEFLFVNSRY